MSNTPTLLSIAKADLKTAKRLVDSEDKYEKHIAAYHTQQAIEKVLKYLAGQKGKNLWGHDITKLVIQCKKLGISVPKTIETNSAMYTEWEVVSRYYPRKAIRRNSIKKAIFTVESWMNGL